MKRPRVTLRDLFWLVLVAAMGLGWWVERAQLKQRLERDTRHINVWSLPDESLESFVDADLRQLVDKTELKAVLSIHLPEDQEFWPGPEPWHLWRHELSTNRQGFVLFEGCHIFSIPGISSAAVHVLSRSGAVLGSTKFSTGYRIDLQGAVYRNHPELGKIIEVASAPTINGEDIRRQMYSIIDNRVALLRLEDGAGNLVLNSYSSPHYTIGPPPPDRTPEEWEESLDSDDTPVVLESLTWIGGYHRRNLNPPPANASVEETTAAQLAADVRQRAGVRQAIMRLSKSDIAWIREAAQAATKSLQP
jgi:hypothetical protein